MANAARNKAFNIFIQHTSALARAGNPAAVKTLKNLLARPVSRSVSNSLGRAGVPRAFTQQYVKDRVALQTLMNTVDRIHYNHRVTPSTINASLAILRRRYIHPDTVRGPFGKTLLMLVLKSEVHSDIAMVRELVNMGADVNAVDVHGRGVLMAAVERSSVAVVSFLLSRGARMTAVDHHGYTVMSAAIESSNLPVVKYLIGVNARIHPEDLIAAATVGSVPMCTLLLDHGENVNYRDREGHTALMHAASMGNINVVKFFLRRGATVKPSDVPEVRKMQDDLLVDENNVNDVDREIMQVLQNVVKKRKRNAQSSN